MKNTPFEAGFFGSKLPKEVQLARLRNIIREALSPAQREVLEAYYFQHQTIPRIAAAKGVHKSTISRTLRRAEKNLRRYLKY
jgi:RNA polymerase sigma factor (sigma-70 family)